MQFEPISVTVIMAKKRGTLLHLSSMGFKPLRRKISNRQGERQLERQKLEQHSLSLSRSRGIYFSNVF
jgi:hypothetical protein